MTDGYLHDMSYIDNTQTNTCKLNRMIHGIARSILVINIMVIHSNPLLPVILLPTCDNIINNKFSIAMSSIQLIYLVEYLDMFNIYLCSLIPMVLFSLYEEFVNNIKFNWQENLNTNPIVFVDQKTLNIQLTRNKPVEWKLNNPSYNYWNK